MSAVLTSSSADHRQSESDDGYPELERSIRERVSTLNGPLFTTDCSVALYDEFLAELPKEKQQHYNCRSCRKFVETYGHLVSLNPDGLQIPIMWTGLAVSSLFRDAVAKMIERVSKAKVDGVFYTTEEKWGNHKSDKGWTHLRGTFNNTLQSGILSAHQKSAEKLEDRKILLQGMVDYPIDLVKQAVRVLTADALDRSEKTVGVAKWFLDVHTKISEVKNKKSRENMVWLAVALAPAGFCHVRSTMISTLLDDLKEGMSFDVVKEHWSKKMHPLQYQRPTAAPKDGAIEQAEKLVKTLGLESALNRRFARLSDVVSIWRPKAEAKPAGNGGVFGHLKSGKIDQIKVELPQVTMTFEKFKRTVLPDAMSIEYDTNCGSRSYFGMVTAADPESKPILQWDGDPRNQVSWYFWNGGSTPSQWGLSGWVKVNAICAAPPHWHHPDKFKHYGEMAMFLLEGARETRLNSLTGGLFPECLRSELHGIRSVVEAHSNKSTVAGVEEGDANGVSISKQRDNPLIFRVKTTEGYANYKIDRLD